MATSIISAPASSTTPSYTPRTETGNIASRTAQRAALMALRVIANPAPIGTSSDNLAPDPETPWTSKDEDGRVYQMRGHHGRPGTRNFCILRQTHPSLRPGDTVTVYPLQTPDGPEDNCTIVVEREGMGLAVIKAKGRLASDVLGGVAWESQSSNFTVREPWDGIIGSADGPAAVEVRYCQ